MVTGVMWGYLQTSQKRTKREEKVDFEIDRDGGQRFGIQCQL